jgi:hypothetical protein
MCGSPARFGWCVAAGILAAYLVGALLSASRFAGRGIVARVTAPSGGLFECRWDEAGATLVMLGGSEGIARATRSEVVEISPSRWSEIEMGSPERARTRPVPGPPGMPDAGFETPAGSGIWLEAAGGWPMRCVTWRIRSDAIGAFAVEGGYQLWSGQPIRSHRALRLGATGTPNWVSMADRVIGYRPLIGGLLLNGVVYGGVFFGVRSGFGVLRRRWRASRGLCPACRYPLGGSAICPECGLSGGLAHSGHGGPGGGPERS